MLFLHVICWFVIICAGRLVVNDPKEVIKYLFSCLRVATNSVAPAGTVMVFGRCSWLGCKKPRADFKCNRRGVFLLDKSIDLIVIVPVGY